MGVGAAVLGYLKALDVMVLQEDVGEVEVDLAMYVGVDPGNVS